MVRVGGSLVADAGRSFHMNPAHVGARRAQDHIALGLDLRDSRELDAPHPFSPGKPLVYVQSDGVAGPCRTGPKPSVVAPMAIHVVAW